jgi:hypothetical protein
MILEKSGDGWWRGQYGNKVRIEKRKEVSPSGHFFGFHKVFIVMMHRYYKISGQYVTALHYFIRFLC